MKPVLLEMTAFGSYVQPTTVDFRKLKHSLYLITGDTGAGKTTIFDAIMVALYGEASGKGENKSRTFENLHCDYVEQSVDTKVMLTFEHMGKIYKVERVLHFKKKRGTGEYEKTTPQAHLWEPSGDVLEKTEAVNRRITELLGMSAEQFRKIAMLAQGEFRKFLDADSETKNRILGELFDNSAYVYFQELFAAARKKLEQDRNEKGTNKIKRAMDDFLCPEEADDEEWVSYSAADPHLESALCDLVNRDRKQQEELKRKEKDGREKERKLHEAKGRAKEQNRLLEELAAKEKEREELHEKKESVERLKEQMGKAERAFYKVRPIEMSAIKAEEDYESTVENIGKTRERLGRLEEDRKNKEQAWKECGQSSKPVIDRLSVAISNMEESMPLYGKLKEILKEQEKEQKLAEKAGRQKQTAEENKNRIAEEIADLKDRIKELEGVDVEKERLTGESKRAEEDLEKLISPEGIIAQVNHILEKEKTLKREQKALREIIGRAGELDACYHTIYQAFLEGQAGILAKSLEQELKEKEEAVCPVCRTVFHGAHAGHFAKLSENVPEKKEVDEARRAFDKKERERQEKCQVIAGLEMAVCEKKAGVSIRLQELDKDLKGTDWETVCADGWLDGLEARYRLQKERAEDACNLALAQSRKLKDLKEEAAKKEEEEDACRRALEESAESERKHKQACENLKTVAGERIKSLNYYEECPDEESAERKKEAWEKEKQKKQQEMEQKEECYHRADRQCEETRGALQMALEALPKLEAEKTAAAERLQEAMAENGFDGLRKVNEILQTIGDSDAEAEKWILEKREEIVDFENRLKNTESRITELKNRTRGLKETDLEELDLKIKEEGEVLSEIQRQLELYTKKYENHKKTSEIVQAANRTLKDTQAAWERLNSLADLANGANAAGGRLSFDRYVMGYVFREILEMANRRLDIMSGGRYELRHEMQAGRDNAVAGLEVAVFDMTTGRCRPSQTLSGGEAFFVSLALALGLSDVVQNHAGGKQLDTLFIDEGFGSLDNDVLDRALAVLNQLTEGKRLVGIISHVARLEESIPQQIRVKKGDRGSTLEIVG